MEYWPILMCSIRMQSIEIRVYESFESCIIYIRRLVIFDAYHYEHLVANRWCIKWIQPWSLLMIDYPLSYMIRRFSTLELEQEQYSLVSIVPNFSMFMYCVYFGEVNRIWCWGYYYYLIVFLLCLWLRICVWCWCI